MFRKKAVPRAAARLPLMWHLFDQFYRTILNLPSFQEKDSYAIVVASANGGEGTSTVALNMTYAYAYDSTRNALLIDGNLRTPVLHSHFGVPREKGLTELVEGTAELHEVLVRVQLDETERSGEGQTKATIPGFHFIPAGHSVVNPIVLYQSPAFLALLEQLRNTFSFIIIDASPLIHYPETPVLAGKTDGAILVLQHEETSWEVAQVAQKYLQMTNARIIGAILNKRQFFIPKQIFKYL
ncbi:MAG: CpsD/CapB family tyrosine-protein kinase [Deltaproteobacteria bacterium]|nr:CpsD/CapB family tyrosine-protein kinase [Deltaproteobacteria bacterium]